MLHRMEGGTKEYAQFILSEKYKFSAYVHAMNWRIDSRFCMEENERMNENELDVRSEPFVRQRRRN